MLLPASLFVFCIKTTNNTKSIESVFGDIAYKNYYINLLH